MTLRHSLLSAAALVFVTVAFAQSAPATNQSMPPAPPRTDAPGSPINPQQANAPAPVAPDAAAAASQTLVAEPASTPSAPMRELNFGEADVDGDKKITLTEYTNFVGNRSANRSTDSISEELIERFRQLDRDGDAALTESEASATPAPVVPQSLLNQPAPVSQPPR